ncbi:hypothetical protein CW709_01390 [Candidatus Bathyarchaeota archaeon]|nr:MAG: hypothetical protein CW709_01390 [Candidatus Bathyarchaeota archaeon]
MNREVKCTSKGKRRLKPLLTPREQTLYRNRFNYFKRIDRENALDRTLKWFEAWLSLQDMSLQKTIERRF